MSLRIRSLHIYPVKSCAGIDLSESPVDQAGLAFDRRWMVVSGGQFLTQRGQARLHYMSRNWRMLASGRRSIQ